MFKKYIFLATVFCTLFFLKNDGYSCADLPAETFDSHPKVAELSENDSIDVELTNFIKAYRNCLPQFKPKNTSTKKDNTELTESDGQNLIHFYNETPESILQFSEDIVDFLLAFSTYQKPDLAEKVTGRTELVNKIQDIVMSQKPLTFILPGFPFKSCNDKIKVFRPGHIDLADFIGVLTLTHLCEEISRYYPPNAAVKIVPDAVRVTTFLRNYEERYSYHKELKEILPPYISVHGHEYLENKQDFFAYVDGFSNQLFHFPSTNDEAFQKQTSSFVSTELNCDTYRALRFHSMMEDASNPKIKTVRDEIVTLQGQLGLTTDAEKSYSHIQSLKPSKGISTENRKAINQIKTKAGELIDFKNFVKECAKINAEESQQIGQFLKGDNDYYYDCIRLSINHRHTDISQKICLPLLYGNTETAWHNVVLINQNGKVVVGHKTTFEKKKYKKTSSLYKGMELFYFTE